jgi:hypothetical protein
MTASLGIPDDTPANTVKNIELILRGEAGRLGATFKRDEKIEGIFITLTLDVTLCTRSFRLRLSYVESFDIHDVNASIGSGFIFTGRDHWNLELLPQDMEFAPHSPAFRWGLYPQGRSYLHCPPTHILDGALLRQLLHESLFSEPPASA